MAFCEVKKTSKLNLVFLAGALLVTPSVLVSQQTSNTTSFALDLSTDYSSLTSNYRHRGALERIYWALNAAHAAYEEPTLSSWTATGTFGTTLMSSALSQVKLEAKITWIDHYNTALNNTVGTARLVYMEKVSDNISITGAMAYEDDWTTAPGQDHQALSLNIGGTAQLKNITLQANIDVSDVDFETPLEETHNLYSLSLNMPISDSSTISGSFADGVTVSTFITDEIHVRERNEVQKASFQLTHNISDSLTFVTYYSHIENIGEVHDTTTQTTGLRAKLEF